MPQERFLRSMPVLALLMLCLCTAGAAFAEEAADKLGEIRVQQVELQRQLDAGELVLTPRQTNALRKAQAEAFEIMQGAESLESLDMNKRVRLENALERINAVVVDTSAASSEKQVCKRVALTGTAMKTTRCATQAEWDQLRETSRNALERRSVCEPPGCGS